MVAACARRRLRCLKLGLLKRGHCGLWLRLVGGKMLPTGVEPVTLGLLDPRSNRLSYESTSKLQRSSKSGTANSKTKVPEVGFEPTKLAYEILSLTPLTNLGTLALE